MGVLDGEHDGRWEEMTTVIPSCLRCWELLLLAGAERPAAGRRTPLQRTTCGGCTQSDGSLPTTDCRSTVPTAFCEPSRCYDEKNKMDK